VAEFLRDGRLPLLRAVDGDGDQEGLFLRHVAGAIHREAPLPAEISLIVPLGIRGDQRDEQTAVVNAVFDLAFPDVAAPQLGPVEPHLDAGGAQRRCDALGGGSVFRGIAQKYGCLGLLLGC
jgi:hypothetical protein